MTTIRASSLSDLLDCPLRWYARHVLHMTTPRTCAAQLGTAVHRGTAVYDQSTIDGAGLTPDDAAGAVVDAIRDPGEDVDWADWPRDKAEAKAIELHIMYCTDIAPTQQYIAVEITCERLDIDIDGFALSLTGSTDRVRKIGDTHGIADIKTGKTAVGTDGTVKTGAHRAQIGVYELLAEHAMGIDIGAPAQIIGLNSGKPRSGIGEIEGARGALIGPPDAPGLLEMVARIVQAEAWYGNPRSMLCSPKYCPYHHKCTYR